MPGAQCIALPTMVPFLKSQETVVLQLLFAKTTLRTCATAEHNVSVHMDLPLKECKIAYWYLSPLTFIVWMNISESSEILELHFYN